MSWPNDADGDVFRRLEANSFDFRQPHTIDFNIDFESWPPATDAIQLLRSMYGAVELFPPDASGPGYAQFQVLSPVSYELVTSVQRKATAAMVPFGGELAPLV
jgi:hypothetical protein